MDIDLGDGIDGTEAARLILSQRELPIVFLTGHAEREMVHRVNGITRYGCVLQGSGEFVLIKTVNAAVVRTLGFTSPEVTVAHCKNLGRALPACRAGRGGGRSPRGVLGLQCP